MEQAEKPPKNITVRHDIGKPNVLLVLKDAATGQVIQVVGGHNLVTSAGDKYYAQVGARSVPSQTFNVGVMAIAFSYRNNEGKTRTWGDFVFTQAGPIVDYTGKQSFDSGYPKASDSDTDNTGRGPTITTYRRTYTTAQGNFKIKALGIARSGSTTSATATLRNLLNYITLPTASQITKTSSQTLKVFVNHQMLGV